MVRPTIVRYTVFVAFSVKLTETNMVFKFSEQMTLAFEDASVQLMPVEVKPDANWTA